MSFGCKDTTAMQEMSGEILVSITQDKLIVTHRTTGHQVAIDLKVYAPLELGLQKILEHLDKERAKVFNIKERLQSRVTGLA